MFFEPFLYKRYKIQISQQRAGYHLVLIMSMYIFAFICIFSRILWQKEYSRSTSSFSETISWYMYLSLAFIKCCLVQQFLLCTWNLLFWQNFSLKRYEIKIYVTILNIICETQGDGIYCIKCRLSITTRRTYSSLRR
jgi:hypothetical protein